MRAAVLGAWLAGCACSGLGAGEARGAVAAAGEELLRLRAVLVEVCREPAALPPERCALARDSFGRLAVAYERLREAAR